jgi:hypothetical protein
MIALFKNGVIGSLLGKGYNKMILRTFIAIMIIIEIVASNLKLSGKYITHRIANIIATILHKAIHIIKLGIKVLGASFFANVIILWM